TSTSRRRASARPWWRSSTPPPSPSSRPCPPAPAATPWPTTRPTSSSTPTTASTWRRPSGPSPTRSRAASGSRPNGPRPAHLAPGPRAATHPRPLGGAEVTRFLYSNMKGRRLIVAVAIALTFVAVGSDILMAFPLKFILDKIIHHKDPVIPLLGGLMTRLDRYGTRNGLNDLEVHTQLAVIIFAGATALALAIIGAPV